MSATDASAPTVARLVWLIGFAQILAWGSLYYTITVLGRVMAADLGVAPATAFGAYSVGVFVSGLVAPYAGKWIDERGGRSGLTLGSMLGGGALALIAASPNVGVFYAGWILAGVAMAFALYDPAFAALARVVPNDLRRAVTLLTLLGGFASTVFWPLTQWLYELYGWRTTLGIYAIAHFLVGIPLNRLALAGEPERPVVARDQGTLSAVAAIRPGFTALATAFALASFVISAMGAHVISLLTTDGLRAETAVWIAALIGPMQVLGRIVEFTAAKHVSARSVGRVCLGLLILALALLAALGSSAWLAVVCIVFYGWANGTLTIVRGTLPAELYGKTAYGALLGSLTRPAQIARAFAPFAVAIVLFQWWPAITKIALVAIALAAYLFYEIALRQVRLHR